VTTRSASTAGSCRKTPTTRPVARLREAIDAEEPESVELLNYRKEGTPFWNRVSVAPIRAGDGSVSEWVGFQENITAFKDREAALERQNDRLDSFAGIVSRPSFEPTQRRAGPRRARAGAGR